MATSPSIPLFLLLSTLIFTSCTLSINGTFLPHPSTFLPSHSFLPTLPGTTLPGTAQPDTTVPSTPATSSGSFVPSNHFLTLLRNTMNEIQKMTPIVARFHASLGGGLRLSSAISDCLELFDLSNEELSWSVSSCQTSNPGMSSTGDRQVDLQSWLSATLTNQATCKESLAASGSILGQMIATGLDTVTSLMSQCLVQVAPPAGSSDSTGTSETSGRKLGEEFPEWVNARERSLLQAAPQRIVPDAVVAKDGSGKYTTIQAAVDAAPEMSNKRHVIHVKRGVYKEYVEVKSKKWNVMLVGDGVGATVITGNRNVVDGWTTFRSATLAAVGKGFMARDLTIENTAGAEKHQAVALRSDSDLSIFHRCSFEGYQDTLYAHALRQFYHECKITGTIDFVFGDAAAVFQNCKFLARKPLPNQQNIVTAQGRKDPNQNTGFAIQFCNISADGDLAALPNPNPTYLARPWKEYSRTVIMQSYIGGIIRPEGYLEWNGNLGLNTLFYGEFNNSGPGSRLAGRVKWPGFHVLNRAQVERFTVAKFIQGNMWLPRHGVAYKAGL